MNSIISQQNTQQNLDLLAAQRQLYTDAKNCQIASFLISVLSVTIFSTIITTSYPNLQDYSNFWSIIAALSDTLLFSNLQKRSVTKAATIQQIFDSNVLEFDWDKLNCGNRIDPETIINAKKRLYNKSNLNNWYSPHVENLPIFKARIICQRVNAHWDSQLRKRYSWLLLAVTTALVIFCLFIALLKSISVNNFILNLVPLLPIILFFSRQYIENQNSIKNSEQLTKEAQNLFEELKQGNFSSTHLEKKSYQLQNDIYQNRRESPVIIDLFYKIFRSKDEISMDELTKYLVREIENC